MTTHSQNVDLQSDSQTLKHPQTLLTLARSKNYAKRALIHHDKFVREFLEQQRSNVGRSSGENFLPVPCGALRSLFQPVTEIFIGGGGGAGRSLPSAVLEAINFGLDLSKVKVVCATSVGTIMGLAIALEISPPRTKTILEAMPADQFQDWTIRSAMKFFSTWGICEGKFMPIYFRQLIKDETGLEDPTFLELYKAGYKKEFRVVVADVTNHTWRCLSYKNTPNLKVAQAVGLACSVPLVYQPQWLEDEEGKFFAVTDGGIINNYPFGLESDADVPLEEQLGFVFANKQVAGALSKHGIRLLFDSILDYLHSLFTIVFFQNPLGMSEAQKERTIVINASHNPLKFTATPEEQRLLDEAGEIGVRRFVATMVNSLLKKAKPQETPAPILTAFNLKKLHGQKPLLSPTPPSTPSPPPSPKADRSEQKNLKNGMKI